VEKSAGLNKFGLSAGPQFDSGRNPVTSNRYGFEQIDPQLSKGSKQLFTVIKAPQKNVLKCKLARTLPANPLLLHEHTLRITSEILFLSVPCGLLTVSSSAPNATIVFLRGSHDIHLTAVHAKVWTPAGTEL